MIYRPPFDLIDFLEGRMHIEGVYGSLCVYRRLLVAIGHWTGEQEILVQSTSQLLNEDPVGQSEVQKRMSRKQPRPLTSLTTPSQSSFASHQLLSRHWRSLG